MEMWRLFPRPLGSLEFTPLFGRTYVLLVMILSFQKPPVKTGLNYSEGIYLRRKAPSRSEERSCVVDWATAAPSGCTHGAGVWSQ